jgi:hypothetical protein
MLKSVLFSTLFMMLLDLAAFDGKYRDRFLVSAHHLVVDVTSLDWDWL